MKQTNTVPSNLKKKIIIGLVTALAGFLILIAFLFFFSKEFRQGYEQGYAETSEEKPTNSQNIQKDKDKKSFDPNKATGVSKSEADGRNSREVLKQFGLIRAMASGSERRRRGDLPYLREAIQTQHWAWCTAELREAAEGVLNPGDDKADMERFMALVRRRQYQ